MRTAQQVRRMLIAVAIVFVLLNVASMIILLSPAGRSRAARETEYEQLRREVMRKRAASLPSRDMEGKLAEARKQVQEFYKERLPATYSDISDRLAAIAQKHHVQLTSIKYETNPVENSDLQRVTLNMGISGAYRDQIEFINALEREKMIFVIDQVNFGGPEQNSQNLRVSLRLDTFLRSVA